MSRAEIKRKANMKAEGKKSNAENNKLRKIQKEN